LENEPDRPEHQSDPPSNGTPSVPGSGCPQARSQKTKPEKRKRPLVEIFAVAIAVIAAAAAFWQGWIARDTEKRQLRAYVAMLKGIVAPGFSASATHIAFAYRNFGQTPAYHVHVRYCRDVIPMPPPPDRIIPISNCATGTNVADTILFPQIEVTPPITVAPPLSEQEISSVSGRQSYIAWYGTFEYSDIFRAKLTTEFCMIMYLMFEQDGHLRIESETCTNHRDAS